MLIQRRTFLQTGTLAAASLMVPRFLQAMEGSTRVPPGNKVMVVLQLTGGNDGLNTVIPYRNDIYYRSRPGIGIRKENSLRLTDEAGLHASLPAFKSLYDEGSLGILNSVGYPEPDRSHFRSMDIWQTASRSDEYLQTGWLGRYLDLQCKDCAHPTQALEMDDVLSLALKGSDWNGIAVKDPGRLYQTSRSPLLDDLLKHHEQEHAEHTAAYLYKTLADTKNSAEYIFRHSRQFASGSYPATELGKSLKTIASLIFSDINTKVYYVSLGSFDTHIAQDAQQRRLFTEMNDAVHAFVNDLKKNNRFDDVMLVSFSEFGRRVAQNASGGTDHGTANNMFFIGGALKEKGILNVMPDLSKLDDGDLRYQVDFRQVYATLLDKWLGVAHSAILGESFTPLSFL
ncbi:DUF1501 domain-containing protein [Flavihumibacter stibioxidans]|uniref:Twin-arginine translocation pathway signal n=1 Tax=Flavihumibacter stibioxidans TaxID=1834163 RepID=A0ABR7M987_9BACT|nr:DUF1501 domain-containing protein [Flavihumibacter stibioxidans]MBC6491595.1 twin-arginine translocation pathway signal [Flavihumibacter stibioxidans]